MNPALKRKIEHQERMKKLIADQQIVDAELRTYQNSAKAKAIDAEILIETIDAFLSLEDIK